MNNSSPRAFFVWKNIGVLGVLLPLLGAASMCFAQDRGEDNPLRKPTPSVADSADSQARLAERYDRLEMLAGRLAELSRATQPRRAKLLQELIAKSHELGVGDQFGEVLQALQKESLGSASELQGELHGELKQLLELLLREDRERQIESERKRVRKYLAELNRLIRLQRGVRARTEGGDDSKRLAGDQQRVAGETDKLRQQMIENEGAGKSGKPSKSSKSNPSGKSNDGKPSDGKPSDGKPSDGKPSDGKPSDGKPSDGKPSDGKPSDGKPSDGKPSDGKPSDGESTPDDPSESSKDSNSEPEKPSDRAMRRLKQARQRMQEAQKQLKDLQRKGAFEEQAKALEALQQAKAELQRILRQLREEELERMLVMLEARFRKMLAAQIEVYEETKKIDAVQTNLPPHELEIAAGRLSRKQRQIVREAERAILLLREDGTSQAFPEALDQAKYDMQTVATRLAATKLGTLTQTIEQDIITALEESLAAIRQAIKKLRQQKGQPQKSSGEPGEQPLVDQLAELRMIRVLQNRVNHRTALYDEQIEGDPLLAAELQEAIDRLTLQQQRIFEATRDLHSGINQ